MRLAGAVLAVALVTAFSGNHASASCRPPVSVAENAARAELVVYGTVTSATNGAATIQVERVLKGSATSTMTVWLGPSRGGSGGTTVATSVDYSATAGVAHVLYLIRGSDGQLETNDCVGSHEGAPTVEEQTFFGAGTPPTAGGATAAPASGPLPVQIPAAAGSAAVITLATLALGAALLLWRMRILRTR